MNDGVRVLKPYDIDNIATKLGTDRKHLLNRVETAVGRTITFAQAASTALGYISYSEAINGIIEFFKDEMRKTS